MAKNGKNEVISLCESKYLQGYDMQTIATNFDVKIKTLYNWAYKGNWVGKREELNEKMQASLFEKMASQVTASVQRYMTGTTLLSQIACEALNSIYEAIKADETQNITARYTKHLKQIDAWAGILAKGSTIHKHVIPDANEQITQKILGELREIKLFVQKKTGQ